MEKPNIRSILDDDKYKSKDGIHFPFPFIQANKELYIKFSEILENKEGFISNIQRYL